MKADTSKYFDNAATTPIAPEAIAAMLPCLSGAYGNAESIHQMGRAARDLVENAREQAASLIGAESPEEIVFTSGATESNNWAIQGILRWEGNRAFSPFEHSSIREPAEDAGIAELASSGFAVDLQNLQAATIMAVNNETGALVLPDADSRLCAKLVHTDFTQALGRFQLNDFCRVDWASASAHKIYGPQGVGMFYAKDGLFPEPFLRGGGHEYGFRAGTHNVAGIVGFGAACDLAASRLEEDWNHAKSLREVVRNELEGLGGVHIVEHERQVPHILMMCFEEVQGESVVIEADQAGLAISSGAACSSGSNEPSHVLVALGLPTELIRGAVRISFGRQNTRESAANLGKVIGSAVKSLRKLTS